MEERIESGDTVTLDGQPGPEPITIVGSRTEEPSYLIQHGDNGASREWANSARVQLLRKAPKPDFGDHFVPL